MLIRTLVAVVIVLAAQAASAQHIYLDSNGNGISDSGDRLNANGVPTTVDVWLNTGLNRDGNPPPPDASGNAREFFSYVVCLQASGGAVTYSGFINRQDTMWVNFLETNSDGVGYKNGYGGTTFFPEGAYKLCTLTITGVSGAPRIDIVDIVDGSYDFTSFGTPCWGQAYDNTYKLDGPNTQSYQGTGDFFDADGLAPSAASPVVTNPGDKTVDEGTLLQFPVTATHPNSGRILTYSLSFGTPAATGATINPSTGVFSWTPSATQGPGVYAVTVIVTDDATPPASGNATFTITVHDVPPVSDPVPAPAPTDNGGGGGGGGCCVSGPATTTAGPTLLLLALLTTALVRRRVL